jgi:hypothetical protein
MIYEGKATFTAEAEAKGNKIGRTDRRNTTQHEHTKKIIFKRNYQETVYDEEYTIYKCEESEEEVRII